MANSFSKIYQRSTYRQFRVLDSLGVPYGTSLPASNTDTSSGSLFVLIDLADRTKDELYSYDAISDSWNQIKTTGAGKSAYEIAVDNGYVGTETDWLASLHGASGKSAYQEWVDNGHPGGTVEDFINSLKGQDGIGIPSGGATGEVLRKKSTDPYDVEWSTPAGGGDMLSSVYDPTGVNGDAFDYGNLHSVPVLDTTPTAALSGTANTYTGTFTPTVALTAGLKIRFMTNVDNTGASTLDADGTGAKAIVAPDGSALSGGELKADQYSEAVYNGTAWQLLGGGSGGGGGSIPPGGTTGQVLKKNSSTDYDTSWQDESGVGGAAWGSITGSLEDQTDLKTILDEKISSSGWTAGDILYADADGNLIALGKGYANTVLKMKSDGTAPEWGTSLPGVWGVNGTDLYYNDGNVGIGTDTPSGLLHLSKDGGYFILSNKTAATSSTQYNSPFLNFISGCYDTTNSEAIDCSIRIFLGSYKAPKASGFASNELKIQGYNPNSGLWEEFFKFSRNGGINFFSNQSWSYGSGISCSRLTTSGFIRSNRQINADGGYLEGVSLINNGADGAIGRLSQWSPYVQLMSSALNGSGTREDVRYYITAKAVKWTTPVDSFIDLTVYKGNSDTPNSSVSILKIGQNGNVAVGGGNIDSSAMMKIDSTTGGFLPPRMTTTQWGMISSKAEGLQAWSNDDHGQLWFDGTDSIGYRYNRSTSKFQGFDGTNWVDLN